MKTIEELVKKDLCYQCGTCTSGCPTNAIKMERKVNKGLVYPVIDEEKCIKCKLCLKICPINNIDFKKKNLLENAKEIGIYNSTNTERFDGTASGGIVTETLDYLFEKKYINKAIVVGLDKDKPTEAKSYIIENPKELKEISGSVYQPVAVNELLKKIKEDDRVAVVGLPCHIRGIELLEKNKLVKNIKYKIGLICTIGRGKHGTDITIKKEFKRDKEEIKWMKYRYGTPPGEFIIRDKENQVIKKSGLSILQHTDYIFMPKGCLFCNDIFNDYADITVGDPWGMNKGKKAMAIIKNEEMRKIINDMCKDKKLIFDQRIDREQCIKTQEHSVEYKVFNYAARINTYNKMKIYMPNIKNIELERTTFKEDIGYGLLMINSKVFNSRVGKKIVQILPNKILFKYRDKVSGVNISKRRG